jgi:hypothetical protein
MFNQVDYYLYNYLHPNLLLQTFDNNDNYKYREQLKSKVFLEINYKNAYLAGYIFLKNNIKDNLSPFICENYKLWKCSNKRYPDIIDNDSKCCLNQEMKTYYIKAWLKGLYDSLRGL